MQISASNARQRAFLPAKRGRGLIHQLLLASALFLVSASLAGQSEHAGPLRVPTTLVLVPVFAYDMGPVHAPNEAKWYQCAKENVELLSKLPLSKPFLPKDCRQGVVQGLTAHDFHLFQDGVEQKIQSVVVQQWSLLARDNRTWHYEFSFTPAGKWSTPDLAPLRFYPNGRDPLYLLTYVPPRSEPGKCQKIQVKVARPHIKVLARPNYCVGQTPSDPLFGTPFGEEMQRDLASDKSGKLSVSLQAVPVYGPKGESRVYISTRVPWKSLRREWSSSNWNLHATIGVLGIISGKNGTVAARFSDLAYPSYWPTFVSGSLTAVQGALDFLDPWQIAPLTKVEPAWIPNRYETEIALAPGDYDLQVVLSDGKKFGRAHVPLVVETPPDKQLALSSIVLCKRLSDASAAAAEAAAGDFAPQYVPLVSKGIQFAPAANISFKAADPLFAFFQIYIPSALQPSAKSIELDLRIVAAGTGKVSEDFAPVSLAPYLQPGDPVIPIARKIPISRLGKGAYDLEVRAKGSGGATSWRTVSFTVP